MATRRKHRRAGDNRTDAERGYGRIHKALRAEWKRAVDAGLAQCHAIECVMDTRAIRPGTDWHLGHTADRTAWTGPEHARCNLRDGALRQYGTPPPPPKRSRVL